MSKSSLPDPARRSAVVRPPAETQYAAELHALAVNDAHPKPPGWKLTARAVRTFIIGSRDEALAHDWRGERVSTAITQKFYGDDALVTAQSSHSRATRALMARRRTRYGEVNALRTAVRRHPPGLDHTIQGTAGTTEDAIKYSWNFALLLAEGASMPHSSRRRSTRD